MPVTAAGFVRLRKHQFGIQSAFGTPVNATSVEPYRGSPDVNPNWQAPDIDTGTLDRSLPLFRTASDVSAQLEGPAAYNHLHKLFAASIKGGVSPTGSGAARTWTYQAASATVDPWDYFTDEWGDDVAADNVRLWDGVIERLELTWPEDLGPIQTSHTWRWSQWTYPHTRQALSVSSNLVLAYAADTEWYLNDTSGAIGTTKLDNVVRGASVVIENTVDLKRYANGSNTRFQVQAYGRSARRVSATLRMEKFSAATDEVVDFLAADPVNRYLEARTTSPTIITGSTPYSFNLRLPGNWLSRGNAEIGGNAILEMEMDGFHDGGGLGYPLRAQVVNSVSTLG